MSDPLEDQFGERIDPELDMERIDPRALFEDLLLKLRENVPQDEETIKFVQREYQHLGGSDG